MTDQNFPMKRTANGFTWGPLEVICMASHETTGVMLTLETPKEYVELRVTPTGRIRIGAVSPKPGHSAQRKPGQ